MRNVVSRLPEKVILLLGRLIGFLASGTVLIIWGSIEIAARAPMKRPKILLGGDVVLVMNHWTGELDLNRRDSRAVNLPVVMDKVHHGVHI